MRPPRKYAGIRTTVLRRDAVVATVPVALAALLAAAGPAGAATAGASGVGDPYFPLAGNGGYHVGHYDLNLRYDPTSHRLDGRAVLTVRATQQLTRFDLDLSGLKVTALTVDHVKAGFRRSGQELIVTPRRALNKDQTFKVAVTYTGVPKAVTDPDGSQDGWIPTDDGAFVAGEPQGAMTLVPRQQPPQGQGLLRLHDHRPPGHTAVANGVLLGQRTAARQDHLPLAPVRADGRLSRPRPRSGSSRSSSTPPAAASRSTTPSIRARPTAAAPVLKKLPSVLDWESEALRPLPVPRRRMPSSTAPRRSATHWRRRPGPSTTGRRT